MLLTWNVRSSRVRCLSDSVYLCVTVGVSRQSDVHSHLFGSPKWGLTFYF